MRIEDLEELVSGIRVLRNELEEERRLRKKAEAGWEAMCELLGERIKVEEERDHFYVKVKAEVICSERLMLLTDREASLGQLEEHLAETLAHAIFFHLRAGKPGLGGRVDFERAAVPAISRCIPVPEIPKSRMPDPGTSGTETLE